MVLAAMAGAVLLPSCAWVPLALKGSESESVAPAVARPEAPPEYDLLVAELAARHEPDRPARQMVPFRWIVLLQAARKRRRNSSSLTVGQFYRQLAQLGGFLGRTHDGDPGWITVWRGWQKLSLMVRGAELADVLREKCG